MEVVESTHAPAISPGLGAAQSAVVVKQRRRGLRGSRVVVVVPAWLVLLDCAVRPRCVAMRLGRERPDQGVDGCALGVSGDPGLTRCTYGPAVSDLADTLLSHAIDAAAKLSRLWQSDDGTGNVVSIRTAAA